MKRLVFIPVFLWLLFIGWAAASTGLPPTSPKMIVKESTRYSPTQTRFWLAQADLDSTLVLKKKRFRLGGVTGQWTLVQAKYWDKNGNGTGGGTCTTNTSTCNVTVSSIGVHSALIFITSPCCNATATTLSSVSGETAIVGTACDGGNGTDTGWDSCGYVLNATGGETSFTCTLNQSTLYISCAVLEFKWSGSTKSFDIASNADYPSSGGGCTSCPSPSVSFQFNDAVVSVFNAFGTNTGGSGGSGWVASLDGTSCCSGISVGTNINQTSVATLTWSQTPSAYANVGVIALRGQ